MVSQACLLCQCLNLLSCSGASCAFPVPEVKLSPDPCLSFDTHCKLNSCWWGEHAPLVSQILGFLELMRQKINKVIRELAISKERFFFSELKCCHKLKMKSSLAFCLRFRIQEQLGGNPKTNHTETQCTAQQMTSAICSAHNKNLESPFSIHETGSDMTSSSQ